MTNTQIIDEILNLALERNTQTKDEFHKIQNEVYKKYALPKAIQIVEMLERYNKLVKKGVLKDSNILRKILRKRGVRSLSGVSVISLLTKEFPCPGKCIYCPSFKDLPKSYIPNEPAVQRAKLNKFDPIKQIHNRLRALEITGHKIEKNDVRIIGGTWSFYPEKYRQEFIKGIYDAFNTYPEMKNHIEETDTSNDKFASFKMKSGYKLKISNSLEEAKKINETAFCRVIGIAIETRPDLVNEKEIFLLRKYGITRVEIGYQTTIDEINKLNCRGHTNKESIEATKLLKNAGFKVVAHMMPNLLGSTPKLDKKSMQEVWDNPDFRPDEIKIYPMVVTDNSALTHIWKNGGFKAYDNKTLIKLMGDLQIMIPEYVRVNRTYRDIPASEILHGSTLSNLRQIVEENLIKKGIKLMDIRHREIKDKDNDPKKAKLNILKYEASGGTEYFLTYEDPKDRTIFSLLRLRLPSQMNNEKGILKDYGKLKNENGKKSVILSVIERSFEESNNKSEEKDTNQNPPTPPLSRGQNEQNLPSPTLQGQQSILKNNFVCKEQISPLGSRLQDEKIAGDSQSRLDGQENIKSPYPPERIFSLPEIQNSALIREIHTFGDQLSIGETGSNFGQHIGFGKKLIKEAETIAKENGYNKIAVIAGIGVRQYYKKRGYILEGEYMVKYL